MPPFGALVAEEAVHPVKQGRQGAGEGVSGRWTEDFESVHDAKIRNPGRAANTHKWGFDRKGRWKKDKYQNYSLPLKHVSHPS